MKSKTVLFKGNQQLEIVDIEVGAPGEDEVQVKTLINGICMGDVWRYNDTHTKEPYVSGHEGVSVVTQVGKNVTALKEGDCIYTRDWSEVLNVKASSAVKLHCENKPIEDFIVEPISCAVNATAYLQIYPGDRVILFGAGYMGLLLTQLLAHSPVSELIVVDLFQQNLEMARKFGATRTIQFGTPEGEASLNELESNLLDIAVEGSGAASALDLCTRLTRRGGELGIYSWHHQSRMIDTNAWHRKGLRVLNLAPGITTDDLPFREFRAAERLVGAGLVRQKELITHRYKLEDAALAMQESTVRGEGFIKSILVF